VPQAVERYLINIFFELINLQVEILIFIVPDWKIRATLQKVVEFFGSYKYQ